MPYFSIETNQDFKSRTPLMASQPTLSTGGCGRGND